MQEKNASRRSNRERTRETRAALLKAARKLFIEKGYAETSTPEIVKAAGITRGALYHHFSDKEDLFRAVLQAEHLAIAKGINNKSTEQTANILESLILGSEGFLDAMADKARVRLILLDGPSVLSREELDRMENETSTNELRTGLKAAMEAGEIAPLPLDALTNQLSALFDRAALCISRGEPREDHMKVIEAIFYSLKGKNT